MPTKNELKRMDDLFGRELGRNPFGEPLYKWVFSENTMHLMVVIDPRTSQPVVDWVEKPQLGLDGQPLTRDVEVDVYNECGEKHTEIRTKPVVVLVGVPRTRLRKMAWWLNNRWVVAKWFRFTEDEWAKAYGGMLPYAPRGEYIPCDDGQLLAGELPTLGITEEMIATIKKQLAKTRQDWDEQTERGLAAQEKESEAKIDAVLDDNCSVYSAHPGTASGDVHLPTADFKRNYDSVFAS